jgi:hypothetical protein
MRVLLAGVYRRRLLHRIRRRLWNAGRVRSIWRRFGRCRRKGCFIALGLAIDTVVHPVTDRLAVGAIGE